MYVYVPRVDGVLNDEEITIVELAFITCKLYNERELLLVFDEKLVTGWIFPSTKRG